MSLLIRLLVMAAASQLATTSPAQVSLKDELATAPVDGIYSIVVPKGQTLVIRESDGEFVLNGNDLILIADAVVVEGEPTIRSFPKSGPRSRAAAPPPPGGGWPFEGYRGRDGEDGYVNGGKCGQSGCSGYGGGGGGGGATGLDGVASGRIRVRIGAISGGRLTIVAQGQDGGPGARGGPGGAGGTGGGGIDNSCGYGGPGDGGRGGPGGNGGDGGRGGFGGAGGYVTVTRTVADMMLAGTHLRVFSPGGSGGPGGLGGSGGTGGAGGRAGSGAAFPCLHDAGGGTGLGPGPDGSGGAEGAIGGSGREVDVDCPECGTLEGGPGEADLSRYPHQASVDDYYEFSAHASFIDRDARLSSSVAMHWADVSRCFDTETWLEADELKRARAATAPLKVCGAMTPAGEPFRQFLTTTGSQIYLNEEETSSSDSGGDNTTASSNGGAPPPGYALVLRANDAPAAGAYVDKSPIFGRTELPATAEFLCRYQDLCH